MTISKMGSICLEHRLGPWDSGSKAAANNLTVSLKRPNLLSPEFPPPPRFGSTFIAGLYTHLNGCRSKKSSTPGDGVRNPSRDSLGLFFCLVRYKNVYLIVFLFREEDWGFVTDSHRKKYSCLARISFHCHGQSCLPTIHPLPPLPARASPDSPQARFI